MCNALKWFGGFTVTLLIRYCISNGDSQEPKCLNVTDTFIHCYNQPLKQIPPGTEKIKALNMTSIPKIDNLDVNALASYSHLKELSMINLRDWNFPAEFLTPLKELEVLNITCTNFGSTLKFPPSIKKLIANELGLKSEALSLSGYDFSNLDKLTEISLRSNNITQLPSLNERAPIMYMDLSDNPIANLSQLQLAQFCQLRQLKLSFESHHVDACCCVKVWLTEFDIENTLRCTKNDGECTEAKYPLDNAALDVYNECSKSETIDESLWSHGLILYIAVVVVFFVAIVLLAIKYFRSSAVKAHQNEKKMIKEAEMTSAKEEVKEEVVVEEENIE